MIKVENVDVWGFEHAIRGMRNPLNSWEKSDSFYGCCNGEYCCEFCLEHCDKASYVVGKNDLDLMQRLYKAGTEHRKYLRQIFVSMDITAPLYWWKEFDTYKVGTVANSCSTMHKIHAKEFTLDDFSHEHLREAWFLALGHTIDLLNDTRKIYLESGEKADWWQMIQILPSSYNQKRTITMNYENVMNMVHQREHHKLDEWIMFVENLKKLPYVKDIRGDDNV
ncbi:hypothetical protein [uncultured Phascolarctobacterium sp.]|uniref:hypothetical protein n=1 Tax=uncultured Phascolarctobacterium sp. TaxID=512296 RepID=UPI0027D94CB1|nr:hypothetical protein [uncultured Phascolarctobacterium sp.]